MKLGTPSQPITHVHNYFIDNLNKGTCNCGRIVKYHNDDTDTKKWWTEVLAKGDPNYINSEQSLLKPAEKLTETFTVTVPADPPAAMPVKVIPPTEYKEYHAWLGTHRAEIISDLNSLGRGKAGAKWGITRRSMGQLILAEKRRADKPVKTTTKVIAEPHKDAYETADLEKDQIDDISRRLNRNHNLPPFPVWSNDWEMDVQLEWLAIYKELRLAR